MSAATLKKMGPRVLAVVAVLALLCGGYAAGVSTAPDPEFEETVGGACRGLTRERSVEQIGTLAPAADTYSVFESITERSTSYSGICVVDAGDVLALYLSVRFTPHRDRETWEEKFADRFLPSTGREREVSGWSTPKEAAVYIPCSMSDGKVRKQGGITVRARTESKGGHRATLYDLARKAAEAVTSGFPPACFTGSET